ncbi:MAG: MATE family efflux transporter, partial [Acidobacteriota bacterium]
MHSKLKDSKSNENKTEIDISYRAIARIVVPVLIGQLSFTMMGLIDTVMVGRLGVTALAAVGLGNFITWWWLAFVVGMISGVNTLVAQAIGAARPKAAGVALFQGLYIGLALAAAMAAFWPLVPWIIDRVGATREAAGIATDYMQLRMLGGLGFVFLMVSDSFYRGLGRTGVLMWAGLAQMVLNCGLNYLLIFGNFGAPRLGASGAAWGTLLAQLAVGLFLWATIHGRKTMRAEFGLRGAWRLDLRVLRRLHRLSLPIAIQYFMEMGGITLFFALIARLG